MKRRTLLGLAGASLGAVASGSQVASAEKLGPRVRGSELVGGYFRVWRDRAYVKDGAPNASSMADIPREVGLVIAFGAMDDPNFVQALTNSYIPKLNDQGAKVVTSIFWDALLDKDYQNTASGHQALAAKIIAEHVTPYGADGLDVDIEDYLAGEDLERATGVYLALRDQLEGKILTYDTNLGADQELFVNVYDKADYVLNQVYGQGLSGPTTHWPGFSRYVKPQQYVPGFSFYEENAPESNRWYDTVRPFETSNAYALAAWEPPTGHKGGVFSYALDRDGVAEGDNTLSRSDYSWSRQLFKVANHPYRPGSFTG